MQVRIYGCCARVGMGDATAEVGWSSSMLLLLHAVACLVDRDLSPSTAGTCCCGRMACSAPHHAGWGRRKVISATVVSIPVKALGVFADSAIADGREGSKVSRPCCAGPQALRVLKGRRGPGPEHLNQPRRTRAAGSSQTLRPPLHLLISFLEPSQAIAPPSPRSLALFPPARSLIDGPITSRRSRPRPAC